MNQKLFSRDFILVVFGQIISLFGNATLRFALPLYLLNQTGSAALYGTVMACAFIPGAFLSPVGGIFADRMNKRNIMVGLDFFTAAVVLVFTMLLGKGNLVVLLSVTLMLLYGIAGFYQPAVQASMPVLAGQEHLMQANAVINTISSFSALAGPVLGGILYSVYGLKPVLIFCILCFFLSAVMEIFIKIPFTRREEKGSFWEIIKSDFKESISFVRREKPVVGSCLFIISGVNLFLSAMIIVGQPYLVTEVLGFSAEQANRLYGYAQGAMAAGGLLGGILAGVFAKKLSVKKAGTLLILCSVSVLPIGFSLLLFSAPFVNYMVITVCCFWVMICSSMFTVLMLAFVQGETPEHLVGKVIAVMLMASMCAQPLGNALYGVLFEACKDFEFVVIFFSGAVSLGLGMVSRKVFGRLERHSTGG